MSGIFSSLFKHRKPKPFGFKPIYYNAEKEAREKRIEMIKNEIKEEPEKDEFRKLLRDKWRKNYVVLANKKSNTRILIIAGLLALICYFILR